MHVLYSVAVTMCVTPLVPVSHVRSCAATALWRVREVSDCHPVRHVSRILCLMFLFSAARHIALAASRHAGAGVGDRPWTGAAPAAQANTLVTGFGLWLMLRCCHAGPCRLP